VTAAAVLPREAPEAYIPSDRRNAIAAGRGLPEHAAGSALFADISGFTALSEALAAKLSGHRASEELSRHLNRIFHALIEEVDRFGGSVIYFSGDAVTCWFEGDDGLRATASAFAMQRVLEGVGQITIPGGDVALGMKVAVAVGPARRYLIGDPRIQLLDALAGRTLDRLADAEGHATRGDVIVDRATRERLEGCARLGEQRDAFTVVEELSAEVEEARLEAPPRPLTPEEVRPWLLGPVYERLRAGRGEFLAELRPAIPMFVRFGSIDFENDPEAGPGAVRRQRAAVDDR
jgi:class 3 adenylate cyclase